MSYLPWISCSQIDSDDGSEILFLLLCAGYRGHQRQRQQQHVSIHSAKNKKYRLHWLFPSKVNILTCLKNGVGDQNNLIKSMPRMIMFATGALDAFQQEKMTTQVKSGLLKVFRCFSLTFFSPSQKSSKVREEQCWQISPNIINVIIFRKSYPNANFTLCNS